jgi:2TM family of unknown function (DUF5676)
MKTLTKTIVINSTPERVFETVDDLGVTGMHMTQSSAMMMGSKLNLEYLSENHTGLGSKYRWTGKMMGMKMDFTVIVAKWIKGAEKIWETVGEAKMIIYSWYQMRLFLSQTENKTVANLSITYKKPKSPFLKFISFLFADWYCKWCLKNMLNDTKRILELNHNLKTSFMKLISSKFGFALGLAFSIGFLLCNLILQIGGKDFSLNVMNMIFHDTDFRSITLDNAFSFGKLLGGTAILFMAGAFIGWLTALLYNALAKPKLA